MGDAEEESVKVAVRVRPFNKREKARNATLIVEMQGNTTMLQDPESPNEEPKKFAFDYSYWSHDGYEVKEDGYISPVVPHYCDQRKVYDDIGVSVLNNAWEGFNTSLFAYGQTGSGKSWSIVGYGVNRGIVPIFCEEIFQGIQKQKDEGSATQFEVTFSMLEIYNEQVRDLLNPKSNRKGGLKVRQHPKKGFYVEKLLTVAVGSYADIESRMEEGTTNRTVASTNMNATSSRAHTVVGVTFTQKKKNDAGEETAKTSLINLVDLAGSERADSTGATGDRLKEGAAINQSLSALGNVIFALAEKSQGKRVRVPYRDSVLTKLLKNALGGNSKTIMIAAISPADINYDETLSTLRYADRAKQIKTKAVVNEDPTEKLIRELREQNEKLLEMLKQAQGGEVVKMPTGDEDDDDEDEDDKKELSPEEIAEMRKQIEEELRASMEATEQEMDEMKKKWEDKMAESQQAAKDKEALKKERESTAHLWNLNPDPQLSGMIFHLLKPGTIKFGSKKADPAPDIVLAGLSIQKQHCEIVVDGDKVVLKTCQDARVLVNGEPMTEDEELDHGDRLMFGTSHLYVFHHPSQAKTSPVKIDDITYEMAQEEIAQNSGIEMDKEDKSRDALLLQEDLVDLIPMIAEANAISQELDRKVSFEAVVVPAKARGLPDGRPEPYVCMKNLQSGLEWLWPKNKFINRKFLMQEMYENYEEGEEWQLPDERDPFTESADTEVMIGCVEVSMQSLGYVLDMREQLSITDYRGREVGYLNIEVVPLNKNGEEITEEDDIFIENPSEMVGRDLDFVVRILSARGIPKKYTNVYCKYEMYSEELKTDQATGTSNPEFQFEKKFSYKPCTQEFIRYICNKSVIVQLWGHHATDKKPVNKKAKQGLDTKAIMKAERAKKGMKQGRAIQVADVSKPVVEYITMKKRKERLEHKIAQIRALCDKRTQQGHIAVAIKDIRSILGETTQGRQAAFGEHSKETSNANGTHHVSGERTESQACVLV